MRGEILRNRRHVFGGVEMELNAVLNKLKKHTPSILGSKMYSKYAVLLPLIKKDDGIHILFEVRAMSLRRQPGEICFPGGRIDREDVNEEQAAIRETSEELGIDAEEINEVYPLDFMISPFGMIVYPYVGLISNPEKVKPNVTEVGEVFTIPLAYFFENEPKIHQVNFKVEPEDDFPFDLVVGGENYNWRTRKVDEYFYVFEKRVVWGLTARIVAHFIEMLREE